MKKRIVAIGLDSADPQMIETWMEQGYLKNLNRLKQEGAYGRLNNFVQHCDTPTPTSSTERAWVMFATGCLPHKTGYWDVEKYHEATYRVTHDVVHGAYDYQEYSPFYALGDSYRVAIFDIPVTTLSESVNGCQILGWGGHAPFTPSHSLPRELLPTLIQKYGKNPLLHKDYGYWWDEAYLHRTQEALKKSVSRRSKICRALLQQEEWDLFLTVFGDTHTAGHDFWYLSQPDHPLYSHPKHKAIGSDPMLEAFEAVDQAIGEILTQVPEDTYVMVFSLHGMGGNTADTLSMAILPELLYRFSFPGQVGFSFGKAGTPVPPLSTPRRKSWGGEIWQFKHERNPLKQLIRRWLPSKFNHWLDDSEEQGPLSPYKLQEQSLDLCWTPAMWYQHLWPQMKAFVLPSFSDGHIRINLKGRDAQGFVEPSEYEALCDELTEKLYRLKNARTGQPVVKKVVRTRYSPNDDRPNLPDADLLVCWEDQPADVVDSPDWGRVGPITYCRSGGHKPEGLLFTKGPGIAPNSRVNGACNLDLAPTLLDLLEAPLPDYLDGKVLQLVQPETQLQAIG